MKPTLYLAAGAALAALFWAFPGLDQGAARLFYSPEGGFAQGQGLFARTVYASIPMLETALYIGLALVALARLIPAARRFHARWTVIVYVALSFALGPGLVTNALLKNEIGRARPHQTVEFGGTKSFSAPFAPADQCDRNCAFVSGHAAFAFALMTFVFLMKAGTARRHAGRTVIAFGILVGIGRMMQGAHWLSDVVFAAWINITIAWALYEGLVRRDALAAFARRMKS
jgi:lipid A 4'-phosphatase